MAIRSSSLTGTLPNAQCAKATSLAKQPNESEIPIETAQYIGQDLGGRDMYMTWRQMKQYEGYEIKPKEKRVWGLDIFVLGKKQKHPITQ